MAGQPSKEPCKKEACDIQACLTKNNFNPQRILEDWVFVEAPGKLNLEHISVVLEWVAADYLQPRRGG